MMFAYLFAICLVVKERHYQLPSVPSRGHGIVLLLFFTLTFIAQNVALVNINSKDWWFELKTKKDRIEMGFFVTRYICTLFMFVLGLKAPGITSVLSEDEEVLVDNENEVS
jgi:ATP-binding cassette, subfamily B (MDR/TAP), member 6